MGVGDRLCGKCRSWRGAGHVRVRIIVLAEGDVGGGEAVELAIGRADQEAAPFVAAHGEALDHVVVCGDANVFVAGDEACIPGRLG